MTITLPAQLHADFCARAAQVQASNPGLQPLLNADFDPVAGSLLLELSGGLVRLAVPDQTSSAQIAAMPRLAATQVKLVADGPLLSVLACSQEWTYATKGYPSLH